MGSICPGQGVVALGEPCNKRNSLSHKFDMSSPIFIENSSSFFSEYNLHSKPLDVGSHSEVLLCNKIKNGKLRAVKIIPKAVLPVVLVEDKIVVNVFELLKKIRCRFLVKMYKFFETKDSYYVVMQYASAGSLVDIIEEDVFEEDKLRLVVKQILDVSQALISLGINYFDIRPENVLVKDQDNFSLLFNILTSRQFSSQDFSYKLTSSISLEHKSIQNLIQLTLFMLKQSPNSQIQTYLKSSSFKSLSSPLQDFLQQLSKPSQSLQSLQSHSWLIA